MSGLQFPARAFYMNGHVKTSFMALETSCAVDINKNIYIKNRSECKPKHSRPHTTEDYNVRSLTSIIDFVSRSEIFISLAPFSQFGFIAV